MSKCQCYEEPIRNYYCYYDTPEGCDIDKKIMVTARYGVIAGLVLSTYDILLYSHASGLGPILKRYAVHTVPLGLMGATFAGVANGAMLYRKQNDAYNYFLGGFACGPILASWLGSKHAVLLGGIALGVIGMIKKNAIDSCFTLLPHPHSHRNTVWKWRQDYTLAVDPKIVLRQATSISILIFGGADMCHVWGYSDWRSASFIRNLRSASESMADNSLEMEKTCGEKHKGACNKKN